MLAGPGNYQKVRYHVNACHVVADASICKCFVSPEPESALIATEGLWAERHWDIVNSAGAKTTIGARNIPAAHLLTLVTPASPSYHITIVPSQTLDMLRCNLEVI